MTDGAVCMALSVPIWQDEKLNYLLLQSNMHAHMHTHAHTAPHVAVGQPTPAHPPALQLNSSIPVISIAHT